jgi:hypothetical protein
MDSAIIPFLNPRSSELVSASFCIQIERYLVTSGIQALGRPRRSPSPAPDLGRRIALTRHPNGGQSRPLLSAFLCHHRGNLSHRLLSTSHKLKKMALLTLNSNQMSVAALAVESLYAIETMTKQIVRTVVSRQSVTP